MDGVQQFQGYTGTTRQFTFYHQFLGVRGTQLIDLRRMKGWTDLGTTRWF